jgi:hypothetical protein
MMMFLIFLLNIKMIIFVEFLSKENIISNNIVTNIIQLMLYHVMLKKNIPQSFNLYTFDEFNYKIDLKHEYIIDEI